MLSAPRAPSRRRRRERAEDGTVLLRTTHGPAAPPRARRRERAEDGTVLLLFPAAVMVMLVLAALTLDVGHTHVRAQQLRSAAASAANDAVGALDTDALRSHGTVSFDTAHAERLVRAAVAEGPVPQARVEAVSFARGSQSRWEVAVTLSMHVRFVIAPALPGAGRGVRVTVTEKALALVGDGR